MISASSCMFCVFILGVSPRLAKPVHSRGTLSGGQVYSLSSATFADLAKSVHGRGDPLWSPSSLSSPSSLYAAFANRFVYCRGDPLRSPCSVVGTHSSSHVEARL